MRWAQEDEIEHDIRYNLACTYGMVEKSEANKSKMLEQVRQLPASHWHEQIMHRKVYFRQYIGDEDLRAIIPDWP